MKQIAFMLFSAAAVFAAGAEPRLDGRFMEFDETYALAPGGRVSLENANGDVRITGWDRDEVRIEATKSGGGDPRILVDTAGGDVAIRTHYDGPAGGRTASVEFHLCVPRDAHLEAIRLVNGSLQISGVAGPVQASAVNGGVKADRLTGDARLSTVNGALEAVFDRLGGQARISLDSVNGSITLALPPGASAEFDATNVTGGISNDFGLPVEPGHILGSEMNASLRRGGARIRLRNINGSISILPFSGGRRVRLT